MSGNRFEFLEFGDERHSPPSGAETNAAPGTAGGTPQNLREPDGTPLSQVRVTDPRGYGAVLRAQREEAGATVPGTQHARAKTHLRLAEIIGERGIKAGQFNSPTGLSVDCSGVLFVADSYNHRVQRVTPSGGVAIIGGRGSGRGQFLSPQGIATDRERAFYIVEQGNHRVQKFSSQGVLQLMFGKPGAGHGEMRGPMGIAVSQGTGDIFVADTGNHRIQRFNREGQFLAMIGAPGGLYPPLVSPQAVAVDAGDNLFVADTLARRVVQYDPQGRPVQRFAGLALAQPHALAVDEGGLLYIADSLPPAPMQTEEAGRVQCVDMGTNHLRSEVRYSERARLLARPSGLAVSPLVEQGEAAALGYGDLYVSDTRNHRILRFVWN